MRRIYLDYNATTPVAAGVGQAMQPFFSELFGNPSSAHAAGRIAFEAIEDARGHVAGLVGADAEEIVFTSGGTEANNLAIQGVFLRSAPLLEGHLIISALEHPAVSAPAAFLEQLGIDVTIVACDRQGVVDPDDVRRAIRPDTRLVSIMHANNEIGTIQPLQEIAAHCHRTGVLLHTDAAQSVGKIRVHVDELDVDLLTIAGHKMYAPKGVGALFVRQSAALRPVLHGAGHERGLRPGTENVPYLVALGTAASLFSDRKLTHITATLVERRDRLEGLLQEALGDELTVNGAAAPRLPNTLNVNFPRVSGAELLARVPEICASTGAACHGSETARSATLAAIRLPPQVARGTIRLSVGWNTTVEEVDRAASLLVGAWESLQP
jgi:cysteine desulfurase